MTDMPKHPRDWREPLNPAHPMALARIVRRDRYQWPGGYAMALVTADGAALCPHCVADNFHAVSEDARSVYRAGSGWKPSDIISEANTDGECLCDHCGRVVFGGDE